MMRLLTCLSLWLILLNIPACPAIAQGGSRPTAEIHVSFIIGADDQEGTKDKPLATLSAALRKAREMRRLNDPSITNGIHIILRHGEYTLYEPIVIRPEDSGTPTSPTYIEAVPGEQVTFSGAIYLNKWNKTAIMPKGLPAIAKGKIWETEIRNSVVNTPEFRQLWVNGKKAVRAKDCNGDSMSRILRWNKQDQSCLIPTSKLSLENVKGMELFIHQWWAIAILRIKQVQIKGDSTQLYFHQPESRVQSEHPWPAPWISKETGNSAYYLSNAIQFLDEPGEWYLDAGNRKIYYWPRDNEDMKNAAVKAPHLETLVTIQGTIDNPVSYIYFRNINFQHTGWLRPSQQGHVPHQAGMYMLDAYKLKIPGTPDKKTLENQAWVGRPAAAVQVSFAQQTGFENCRFEHMASTGLDYGKGTQHNTIKGNLFKDIGGSAILAGVFSDEAVEVHLPYNPKDEREICSDMLISNNLITDAANEDWSCVGIGAGYVRNTVIDHNDISNVSYSAISMGWGWTKTKNAMRNNAIIGNKIRYYGKHNYDCAGIYTLSAQPGTLISENYIDSIYKAPYAHLPNHWFYLYTDEGSAYMQVKDNWTPSEKFLQNANGDSCIWTNNGPAVSPIIKQAAGLQAAYQYLAKETKPADKNRAINKEEPAMIELIGTVDVQQLKELLVKNKIQENTLYQWQNHYVIFGKVPDVFVLQERLKAAFPGIQVKGYNDLFYEFNRQYCADPSTAKEWDHIILTANLVPDKKLQQEYLDYHATQFEKWPEVSKGFCNASFQQLLLYRNGRQLMLVISIPKGESLDKLNPKTTENNPRVAEWTRLMERYQEGIEGTMKGETWVLLQPMIN